MTHEVGVRPLRLSQDPRADALLARSPFALLIGFVLDQKVPTGRGLVGPASIRDRLGCELDPAEIAEYDLEQFAAVVSQPPPLHRSPAVVAARIQRLAAHLTSNYGGDVTRMWTDDSSADLVVARFEQLPGFGGAKARVLLALLGKQLGVTPAGWREAAAPYGEPGSRLSLADVVDEATLDEVRTVRRERKQAKKKSGRLRPPR
jgi:uncharacterized HhH-GPD family protein